jgi:aldehyde dehydrogenase (NAD+)
VTALPTAEDLSRAAREAAARCGVDLDAVAGDHPVTSPVNGAPLASVRWRGAADVHDAVTRAGEAFRAWRTVPAPVRGGLVRRFGELLREHKADLGTLVSLEVGKITSEARGEVQEMIDICEFAVGLSRQLYGRTISSERPGHRLMETWHPLGVVGVISAFNFPVAVWSWNTAIALVCGDPVVWKPSELAPVSALAAAALLDRAIAEEGAPADLSQVVVGGADVGEALVEHPGVALLSATGSTRMGRAVGPRVADRFGRSLLELGGNNAAIVTPSADLDLTTRGVVFAAAGTAGQRCTTMRRVIAHVDVVDELTDRLAAAYRRLPIGSPTDEGTLVGPLISDAAYKAMQDALEAAGRRGRRGRGAPAGRRGPGRPLRGAGGRPDAGADRHRAAGDLRADPLRPAVPDAGGGHRAQQRRPAGPVVEHLHLRPGRGRALPRRRRLRLRHRQRQHRDLRGRDRRGLRRGEADRGRSGVRLRRVAQLHAPRDEHDQLLR